MKFDKVRELSKIGSADIIGNAITAFFWLFLSAQISPEQYGEIFYYLGIAATASAFVLVGSVNTLMVYSSKNIKIESTLYFISLILGIIASVIIMVFFYRIDTILLLFGYIINTLAIGQLLGRKLFSSYSKHLLIQKGLTLTLGIIFFFIFGNEGILFALALSYVSFIILIVKGFNESRINFSLLKTRLTFILNNYIIDVLTKLNANLNRLIAVPLLGFTVLGNFSLALQIVSLGMIFSSIVFKYTISHDALGQENKKLKRFVIVLSVVIALLITFVGPFIIPILFPQYIEAIDAIRILSFSIIPMTITTTISSKLLGQENNTWLALSKAISIITFILIVLILEPYFGVAGLAVSYLLATIFESTCLIVKLMTLKNKKS